MTSPELDVLSRFPTPLRGTPAFLGNHGGFSGAQLWRVDARVGVFCLKAWPIAGPSTTELVWIHHLLEKASVLEFVPRVMVASDGASVLAHQDRLWELATWLPGRADYTLAPSAERLEAACAALARLHQIWAATDVKSDTCPAVVRREDSWRRWRDLLQTGWRPTLAARSPYVQACEQLMQLIEQQIDDVPRILTPWRSRPLPLQPCVCDLWHDHVLFMDAAVSGFIDFGSAKIDHVAVDLARLLGSLVGNDAALWDVGLNAYARFRSLSAEERALARDLDRTGTISAATNWLRWLAFDKRQYERPANVLERLNHLIGKLREPFTA